MLYSLNCSNLIFYCLRLPWRRYALDSAESNQPESEDEIYDLASKPLDIENLKLSENIDDDGELLTSFALNSVQVSI